MAGSHEWRKSMKQKASSVSKFGHQAWSGLHNLGEISESSSLLPSKTPCETDKWGVYQAHLILETNDSSQDAEIKSYS